MDNNYYTGATLIRGSHHHHHHHHHHHPQPHAHNHHHNGHGQYTNSATGGGGSASTCGSGSSNPASPTSLAGPPLLMQPRNNKNHLFSGAPLIRNGSVNSCGASMVSVPSQPPPPPQGVICCFQPVYYVPMQQSPALHSTPPAPQLSLPAPPPTTSGAATTTTNAITKKLNNSNAQLPQSTIPKRRNYKSLQISNKTNSTPGHQNHQGMAANVSPKSSAYAQPLTPTSTSNNSIGSPFKQASAPAMALNYNILSTERDTSPVENIYCHTGSNNNEENEINFQAAIESTRYLVSHHEEKQRSDKLLNFYFYDEHWRPQEAETNNSKSPSRDIKSSSDNSNNYYYGSSASSSTYDTGLNSPLNNLSDTETEWLTHNVNSQNHLNLEDIIRPSTFVDNNNNNLPNYSNHHNNHVPQTLTEAKFRLSRDHTNSNSSSLAPGGSTAAMVIKKKDLEVEAQIVTLANGHRDLEIRLCYVTS